MGEANRVNFYGLSLLELEEYLLRHDFKKFHAGQIFEWVYQKRMIDPEHMTNLSKCLRTFLNDTFSFSLLEIQTIHESEDQTKKFLFKLEDGHLIESVLMRHDYGNSVCVTSQVGCNMGCAFCASGLAKKVRNLSLEELVGQVVAIGTNEQIRVSHVVVMGTGEPFDNYDAIVRFIALINHDKGLAIGQRHITVSTAGIVPKIIAYANEPIRSNLAISLHAPNDQLRTRLMPINKSYPIRKILEATDYYFSQTSRRVTFEYVLLKGVNDQKEHIDQLAKLMKGRNAYVNVIPYNRVNEFAFLPTDNAQAMIFVDGLMKQGIQATLRKKQGSDIAAACGQLRRRLTSKNPDDCD